jgi:hypothetical protein
VQRPPDGPAGPWAPPTPQPVEMLSLGLAEVNGRRVLVVGGSRGGCGLWDVRTGEQRPLLDTDEASLGVEDIHITGPDHQPMAVATTSRYEYDSDLWATLQFFYAVVYDLTTGEAVFRVEGLDVDVLCAVGATEHGWVLAAATDSEGPGADPYVIRFFDAVTGAARPLTVSHSKDLWALAVGTFGPGGPDVLATADSAGAVQLWDLNDGRLIRTLQVTGVVNDLALHPVCGLLLATDRGLLALPAVAKNFEKPGVRAPARERKRTPRILPWRG